MWRDYFGPRCHVYGVDFEEACLRYASDSIQVFIGDQADRDFWRRFRSDVPRLDIVVDDGGHKPDQQTTSLEELLAHLSPGGVYVVEDVHGVRNPFARYGSSLAYALTHTAASPTTRTRIDARPVRRRRSSPPWTRSTIAPTSR
jgi:hypothetical protein